MRAIRRQSRGFVLPAVMLFLTIAFGMWAVLFRSSASVIRVEQARVLRSERTTWSAPAMAAGMRLLETGMPPTDPYVCKVALTQDGQTRYFLLNFQSVAINRFTVQCTPTTAADPATDAPETF